MMLKGLQQGSIYFWARMSFSIRWKQRQ